MIPLTKIKTLKIVQWNARSLRPKWPEITQFLNVNQIHVGIIQETWLSTSDMLKDNVYSIIRLDRQDRYGGVAFIIHKSIAYEVVSQFNTNSIQLLIIKIKTFKPPLILYNIYCTNKPINKNFWQNELFTNDDGLRLMCGDWNAHHPYWGANNANKRGNDIFNCYFYSNFILLNNITHTTAPTLYRKTSTIDLSFASPDMHSKMMSWEVGKDLMGSDHFPIIMEFDTSSISIEAFSSIEFPKGRPNVRNFKQANWKNYSKYIEQEVDILTQNTPLNNLNNIINKAI
jgi:hypothetical protein